LGQDIGQCQGGRVEPSAVAYYSRRPGAKEETERAQATAMRDDFFNSFKITKP
jgi:hypothetical protein